MKLATPKTRWVKFNGNKAVEDAALNAWRKPGWNPKTVKLSKYLLAIDYCFFRDSDKIHSFQVLLYKDSSLLNQFDTLVGLPRATKAVFKRDWLLAASRMTDAGSFLSDMDLAVTKYEEYLRNKENLIEKRND